MAASPATDPITLGPSAGLSTMTPAMAEAKNYYAWIAAQVAPAVGRRVLDVGGGRGTLLSHFGACERRFAVDLAADAAESLRQTFAEDPRFEARQGEITDPALQEHFRVRGVDSILCTNVLEHVEDDDAMLTAFAAILAPAAGTLALLVPAHPWLYGSLDTAAGHFRRYTRAEVGAKLGAAGFTVERLGSMNLLAVPGWWFAGRVRRQGLADESSNAQVRFYDRWLIPLTRRLESLVPPPAGLSVLALARASRQ